MGGRIKWCLPSVLNRNECVREVCVPLYFQSQGSLSLSNRVDTVCHEKCQVESKQPILLHRSAYGNKLMGGDIPWHCGNGREQINYKPASQRSAIIVELQPADPTALPLPRLSGLEE